MKQNQRVYIKGNCKRGAEVIKTLEDLGGYNSDCLDGHNNNNYYFIAPDETISNTGASSLVFSFVKAFYKEISLPRWKPKYKEHYYHINWRGAVVDDKWDGVQDEESSYEFGNCFRTFEEAKAARDKIKEVLNNNE